MKLYFILIVVLFIAGCSFIETGASDNDVFYDDLGMNNEIDNQVSDEINYDDDSKLNNDNMSSDFGTGDILLTIEDLEFLNLVSNGTDCSTEEFETSEYSPLKGISTCFYDIQTLNESTVVVEIKEYIDFHNLNGSYQYNSLHMRGFQGLLHEDEFGDLSRFYVSNESNTYYYHFWIVQEPFLILVTSKGDSDARDYVEDIGKRILSKID